ncbi:MAG: anthranilate synthase component I family protein [Methanobacteriota archaeon]|nr:MAG: anthranilate synthase component I family protein [Euryarchaeota archaeon]
MYNSIRHRFATTILLESGEGPEFMARQSIICFDPIHVLEIENRTLSIDGELIAEGYDKILTSLRGLIAKYQVATEKMFAGGLVGYVGFDFFELIENQKMKPSIDQFPTSILGLFLDGIVYDHLNGEIHYFHHELLNSRLPAIKELLTKKVTNPKSDPQSIHINFSTSEQEFVKKVEQAKQKISDGEVFQVVLSQKGKFKFSGAPSTLYEKLRKQNPSPYMYLLQFADLSIIGTSPELLISEENGKLVTFPIAGTRKVYPDRAKMKRMERELLSDPKELAEHNMLVDLARNDLGRVARIGSVKVTEYKQIQRFSHVIHIVSKVEADLDTDKDMFDAFAAVFPAGTVSGAPKIRAIEIIDQLEKEPRGPYAGSVGYFGLGKNMVQAIAIRTAFGINEDFFIQAGAGIVYDSSPELEYKETMNKLAIFTEVLQGVDGVIRK